MPHERDHSHQASGSTLGSFNQRPILSLSSSESDSTLLSIISQVEVDHLTSLQPEDASWGQAIIEEEHTSNFQIEEEIWGHVIVEEEQPQVNEVSPRRTTEETKQVSDPNNGEIREQMDDNPHQ
jgi:hypothetical protein